MFKAVYLYRVIPKVLKKMTDRLYTGYITLKLLSVSALCALSVGHFGSGYILVGDRGVSILDR